ncbi:MAG: glycosyltransferase family 4 protein [Candidatus Moranbacteria bacterium]|jgi:glycosyltransferase involved in cell wall biosynthesis|nr:glycosyltransferase family 4 protein [Candidatus Moranbacteria bacterium]NCA93595.1 glycosyltransferase family 4 protein [Sphingobacteriia bacterium]
MKIAMLAPFEEQVPPVKYGGTELVIYNLIEQLVRLGHEVTLFASGDSKTSAKLRAIFDKSIRSNPEAQDLNLRNAYKYMGVGRVVSYLNKGEFDIIHNHIGWRILPFQELLGAPVVTTLHGPLDVDYQQKVYGAYANSNFISISLSQRKPMAELNFVANVYNGIEIDKFKFNESPDDYFAFLGRMSPEKGPIQAIEIAKKAGVKLLMAAKVDAVDKEFFESKVSPLIDGEQIRFIGEINHNEKVNFLCNAKALIAPIQWEEPFGLFFTEAMICGTPVIAMRRGSVPEIIIDKKTGFICEDIKEASEKIKLIDQINRIDCHNQVKEKFSAEKMARDYILAYESIIKNVLKNK